MDIFPLHVMRHMLADVVQSESHLGFHKKLSKKFSCTPTVQNWGAWFWFFLLLTLQLYKFQWLHGEQCSHRICRISLMASKTCPVKIQHTTQHQLLFWDSNMLNHNIILKTPQHNLMYHSIQDNILNWVLF